ncbi:MAG: hypothetical protein JXA13_00395 [Anaerolineales bacterium]|nr:hypothetical protein [Anaerolineales bacterium]
MNNPEVTRMALDILRKGDNFQWYVITFLALVVYVYLSEISRKNWKGIAAGLALYAVHWFYEILNALVQHFSGHALWTVPAGTSYLILVGVGVELSFMFSIAGLVLSKLLPEEPKVKILGINNRLLFAVGNAALFAIIEIFLAKTPVFVWVYPWWGAFPVFLTVYIPFFLAAFYCYDWQPKRQTTFISTIAIIDILMMVIFAGFLGWI